ncbi:MAG: YggS family pyridoxal phosphate-dependent enzyme [Betaproteobacteria bacterium]|nr:YggS family pyridoxal phosphate-dependent enzyme [Betaproteobacteria bacterium]
MSTLASALQTVRERIDRAARAAGRDPSDIQLLAISKAWPADRLREAWQAGQRAFGENYAQEGVQKIGQLSDLQIEWHFVGPIQSNKTRALAENFTWVHGVDRARIAERLSAARPPHLPPLDVCLQVNVSGEASKSGVAPEHASALARSVAAMPRLRLRGLMVIPRRECDQAAQRHWFRIARELKDRIVAEGTALDTLSMGMSDDLEAAVLEGATIVRVGTAIFGPRP